MNTPAPEANTPGPSVARRAGRLRPCLACAIACAAGVWGGCASQPGLVFDPANGVHQWPPAPDEPRIKYVGQLKSDRDTKAGRSAGQSLGEFLFGKEPVQTLVNPMAVCTDGGQRVFIADSGAKLVHVFDLDRRKYERWSPPPERFVLEQPVALLWDPKGRLLVSDAAAGAIVAFDPAGKYIGRLGEGKIVRPCGLALGRDGQRLFVADAASHQVVVLDSEGEEVQRIGGRGSGLGQFNYPTNVAVDSRGRLYVSDSLNFRVQVFATDLRPIGQIGKKGDMPGYFAQPKGISLDREDHLYVVDANFEAVQLFDDEGRLLMTFGKEGQGPGEFWLPAGMFVDPKSRIWIADSYNRRVQVFDYLPEGKQP